MAEKSNMAAFFFVFAVNQSVCGLFRHINLAIVCVSKKYLKDEIGRKRPIYSKSKKVAMLHFSAIFKN
jgi:hypothetical protein